MFPLLNLEFEEKLQFERTSLIGGKMQRGLYAVVNIFTT